MRGERVSHRRGKFPNFNVGIILEVKAAGVSLRCELICVGCGNEVEKSTAYGEGQVIYTFRSRYTIHMIGESYAWPVPFLRACDGDGLAETNASRPILSCQLCRERESGGFTTGAPRENGQSVAAECYAQLRKPLCDLWGLSRRIMGCDQGSRFVIN